MCSSEGAQQLILKHDICEDAAGLGLCLVDIARHVSRAYAQKGYDDKQIIDRILWGSRLRRSIPRRDPGIKDRTKRCIQPLHPASGCLRIPTAVRGWSPTFVERAC